MQRLSSIDLLLEQSVAWTSRREMLLQIEARIYTPALRQANLRSTLRQATGGRAQLTVDHQVRCGAQSRLSLGGSRRHLGGISAISRRYLAQGSDLEVRVDTALLQLLIDEGMSNALKYSAQDAPLQLHAARRSGTRVHVRPTRGHVFGGIPP